MVDAKYRFQKHMNIASYTLEINHKTPSVDMHLRIKCINYANSAMSVKTGFLESHDLTDSERHTTEV